MKQKLQTSSYLTQPEEPDWYSEQKKHLLVENQLHKNSRPTIQGRCGNPRICGNSTHATHKDIGVFNHCG